jgi:hypothetical protein
MRFQPGNVHMFNGKGGRPRGSKTKLTSKVYDDLLRHWNEPATPGSSLTKGQQALEIVYRTEPAHYLRLVASTLPKEFLLDSPATELSDDELDRMIAMLRERALAARQEQALELKPEPRALINGH